MSICRSVVVNLAVHGRQTLSASPLHFGGPRGASSSFLLLSRWLILGRDRDGHGRIVFRVRLGRFAVFFNLLDCRLFRLRSDLR
jgi:hypothetical protein